MGDRFHIAMYVPGMAFDGETPLKQSLGGSESAGWYLGRALAKRGHRIRMFCNLPGKRPGTWDDVQYFPIQNAQGFFMHIPHDVGIIQRDPAFLANRLNSKFNILWCHDMALARQMANFKSTSWNMDRVAVVSNFMRAQYSKVYELPPELFLVQRNGISMEHLPSYFKKVPVAKWKRDPKKLVYAARPERGLDILLERIVPELLKADPEITVNLYAYDNPVEHYAAFYQRLFQRAASLGDRVVAHPPKDKKALYLDYIKGGIYAYPTPSSILKDFREVSCISAMEAQMCGMPIVSSAAGALLETVRPSSGVLIGGDSTSDAYRDEFVAATLSYMNDPAKYRAASEAGRIAAETMTWEKRAEEWEQNIEDLFRRQNDDPLRLARHFYRRSNVFAAKKAIQPLVAADNVQAIKLDQILNQEYGFAQNEETLREHYRANGVATTERLNSMGPAAFPMTETKETRHKIIEEFLVKRPEITNILDYGCGHGWGTVYWAKKFGAERAWVGCDIDPGAVEWADKLATEHIPQEVNRTLFVCGDYTNEKVRAEGPYDLVIVSEVLEHCIDPIGTLEALESLVKPDGYVLATVPYGPSEYGTHNWVNFKNHIHEIDYEDFCEILKGKADLSINATFERINDMTGDIQGFFTCIYKADHQPLNDMDWDRRLRIQRPRETLSVTTIGGPGCENTLRWCLESVQWVADEIVVANAGDTLSMEALEICASFGAKVVSAPEPSIYGFEEARNAGLDACTMDWVLWIDTDEKLMGAINLGKYLRRCSWTGLSIRQHHFAIDTVFPPDLPVRCFRRHRYKGQTMRFFGAVHEHPEFEMNKGPGPVVIVPDVNIAHVGYLDEATRQRKFTRNYPLMELDQKKYPNRLIQKYFIMRDSMLLNMYEYSQNGQQVSDDMRERARKTVALYREHFLGKTTFVNLDPQQYYSEALRHLGEGIDVAFQLGAQRDGNGDQFPHGSNVRRYATMEDFQADLTKVVKEKFSPLEKPMW